MNEKLIAAFARSGPWTLLAVLLVAFYLLKLDPRLQAMDDQHDTMRREWAETRAEAAADAKALQNILGQILMSTERTAYLQRVQCQNEAETPAELRACAKDHD